MSVYNRIQSACRTLCNDQMASVTDVVLTGDSLSCLAKELSPSYLWVPLFSPVDETGVRVTEVTNHATGWPMQLWLGAEDRLKFTRPSATAWMDRQHTTRRPAKRSAWVEEWVPLP